VGVPCEALPAGAKLKHRFGEGGAQEELVFSAFGPKR
jgi:hypothetical protein